MGALGLMGCMVGRAGGGGGEAEVTSLERPLLALGGAADGATLVNSG